MEMDVTNIPYTGLYKICKKKKKKIFYLHSFKGGHGHKRKDYW